MCWQELRTCLGKQRSWLASIQTGGLASVNAAASEKSNELLSRVVSALLKCCDTEVRPRLGCIGHYSK